MSWWMWSLLWAVLVLGGLAALGWCGWRIFRAAMRLGSALGSAADAAGSVAVGPGVTRSSPRRRSVGDEDLGTPSGRHHDREVS